MTMKTNILRHCEERRDEAIYPSCHCGFNPQSHDNIEGVAGQARNDVERQNTHYQLSIVNCQLSIK